MTKNSLSIEKIIAHTHDAILASGKKFHEIPQEAIEVFLKNSGLPMDQSKKVYKLLKEEYSSKQKLATESVCSNTMPKTPEYVEKSKIPRKSVFGEIKKIA